MGFAPITLPQTVAEKCWRWRSERHKRARAAEIDLYKVDEVRQRIPVFKDRREDIYLVAIGSKPTAIANEARCAGLATEIAVRFQRMARTPE